MTSGPDSQRADSDVSPFSWCGSGARLLLRAQILITGGGDELAEGFTPDDHAAVAGRIDGGGQRHDKVVEGLHRPDSHHLILEAGKIGFGLDKLGGEVELVVRPGGQLAHQTDGILPYAHLALPPVQTIAVFQIPAKGAVESRLLLAGRYLLGIRGGWRDQDRQGVDTGGKACRRDQQMGAQQQGHGFAFHDISVVDEQVPAS